MAARDTARAGVVLLALVMGSAAMGWLLWPPPGDGHVRSARGTVVQSVLCDPGAQDFLHIELSDGRNLPARLDGCGHRLGEVLAVEVPDPLPGGELVVRLSGTGVRTASADGQRLAAVGVTVAGVAGALLMWRLRGSSLVRRRVGA